jgi:hypothetical protein
VIDRLARAAYWVDGRTLVRLFPVTNAMIGDAVRAELTAGRTYRERHAGARANRTLPDGPAAREL